VSVLLKLLRLDQGLKGTPAYKLVGIILWTQQYYKMADLTWLFGEGQGPRTIRLIDSNPEYRRQLEAFAGGAVFTDGSHTYHTYVSDETEAYRDFLSECFTKDDPCIRGCGATAAEFKQHFLKEMLELTDYLPYSLCLKVDGQLAGCVTSHTKESPIEPRYETPASEEVWLTKLKPVINLLDIVQPFSYCYPDERGRLPPSSVDIRSVLHIMLVAVGERFGGRNLCYKLMLISAALGYLRSLTFVMAECTNPRSSNFYKIGGFSLAPYPYRDYEWEGKRLYSHEEDGVRFAFMTI
jgi:hypothetical protein